jgi:NAD(P)H-dependent FMN reductase
VRKDCTSAEQTLRFNKAITLKGLIMKFMMMAASLQKDSCNKKLINLAARLVRDLKHTVDLTDFAEFDVPLYNADIQNTLGLPVGALKFIKHMHDADGLIISSPEYNFSIPGTLKNLIDWISRQQPMPWTKQSILLLSASPSLVGGNRGLWSTRIPLESCGAFVYPDMFSLASAYTAFNAEGQLNDATLQGRLQKLLESFADTTTALVSATKS